MNVSGSTGAPSGAPIRLEGATLSSPAGSGSPLRAGALISVTVLVELGPGLYRIRAGGRELVAQSTAALVPGASLRARVEPSSSKEAPLVLKILERGADRQQALLSSLGLPGDNAARAALSASLAAGLRPEAARLQRIRSALASADGNERERSQLAAGLEARGFGATPGAVDELVSMLDGAGDREGAAEKRDEKRGKAEGRAGEAVEELASGGEAAGDDEGAIEAALAALLRELFSRSGSEAGLLGLYNHARAASGDIFVPFHFELGPIAFVGKFRLQLPHLRGGPLRLEGGFHATKVDAPAASGSAWSFALESTGRSGTSLRLFPPEPQRNRDWTRLKSSLAASGCLLRIASLELGAGVAGEVNLDA